MDSTEQAKLAISRSFALRTLAILCVPVVLGFAVTDWAVGQANKANKIEGNSGSLVDHDLLGYAPLPGFRSDKVQISSLALRSEEIPADAAPTELRILGIGASLSYGMGGNDQEFVWTYALEEMLEKTPQAPRVLNGSVPGYASLQTADRGMLLIDSVQPDLILFFIRPGRQSMVAPTQAISLTEVGGTMVPDDIIEGWPESLRFLPATLHKTLSNWSNLYLRHRANAKTSMRTEEPAPLFTLSRSEAWPKGTRPRVQKTLEEVTQFIKRAKREGVVVRFIICPEPGQTTDASWANYIRDHQADGAPPFGTARMEPTEFLGELLELRGGESWDISEMLNGFGFGPSAFVSPVNLHWNERGHRQVAGTLKTLILESGLLEELAAKRAANPRAQGHGSQAQ